jgi:hypothetical protein
MPFLRDEDCGGVEDVMANRHQISARLRPSDFHFHLRFRRDKSARSLRNRLGVWFKQDPFCQGWPVSRSSLASEGFTIKPAFVLGGLRRAAFACCSAIFPLIPRFDSWPASRSSPASESFGLACRAVARSIGTCERRCSARLRCATTRQSSLSTALRAKAGGEGRNRTFKRPNLG